MNTDLKTKPQITNFQIPNKFNVKKKNYFFFLQEYY